MDDEYWLTDKPAPYYTVKHDVEQLFEWSHHLMTARAGGIEKLLTGIRNRVGGLRGSGSPEVA